jgi:16S rRNA processing protein RimM
VETVTEFPERLGAGAVVRWSRGEKARELRVRSARPRGPGLLLSFDGIETVDSARELTGGDLTVDADRIQAAPADFLYSHQIQGWTCESTGGAVLGRARDLERTRAGPMLSIETASGREVLVPFIWPIVVAVDRDARRIVLDPPEGLLEL